jgi:hypothetical protein
LLIRTCLYQPGEDDEARSYEVGWPILRSEIFTLDPEWEQAPPKEGQQLASPIGPDGW